MSRAAPSRLLDRRTAVFFALGLITVLAAGWGIFPHLLYARIEQPLQLSHALHVKDQGLSCDDCHALGEDGVFAGIPGIAKCAECHADVIGDTPDEKRLVEQYVSKQQEVPWLVYARQPDNVYFSHAPHLKWAALPCERCHGEHGGTTELRSFEVNRLSGYSRDIWGPSMARFNPPGRGMKMTDCADCHRERGASLACGACHK